MATVGQPLTAPEAGWQRFDHKVGPIIFSSTFADYASAPSYSGSYMWTVSPTATIKIKFKGTKIRIIAFAGGSTSYTTQAEFLVDNTLISTYNNQGASIAQVLMAEATGLSDGVHDVLIRVKAGASYGLNLDAIDINDTGYLLMPTEGLLRTKIEDMKVGDYIPCNYTATSGAVGTFSNLGGPVGTEIPIAGASAPNGTFYFVKADKGLLIADRVVQHSVTWDVLNTGKNIQGRRIMTKLNAPSSALAGAGNGVAFSPDGVYMGVSHSLSPFVAIYKRDKDVFTKLPNPSSLPAGTGNGISFSPDGVYMSVAHSSSPYITIYKRDGDTFTKLPEPATLPTSTGNGVAFSSDGNYMSVAHATSPFITIYKRNGDVFTKLSNPATLPPSTGFGVSFSADSLFMGVAHTSGAGFSIYKRNGDTFTKLTDPATGNASGNGISLSPDGKYIATAFGSAPLIATYRRDGDVITRLPNPDVTYSAATAYGVAFSPDGTHLAVAQNITPFTVIYKRDGDSFRKIPNPETLGVASNAVAYSPDGNTVAFAPAGTAMQLFNCIDMTIRSLTGGVAYADSTGGYSTTNGGTAGGAYGAWPTTNEYDTYLVKSTLGGKMIAGDDNVWHGGAAGGVFTWCQDTPVTTLAASTNRVMRATFNTVNGYWNWNPSSNNSATYGAFRPVLEYNE